MIPELMKELKKRISKSVQSTSHQMAVIRTGKASPALLDNLRVECWGDRLPLKQVAGISAPDPSLLVIQPYDPSTAEAIVKAVESSDLGLRASADGPVVRIPIPKLSDERRTELARQVGKIAEEGRTSIRNIRRDINDSLKKAAKSGDITEDQEHRAMDEVQEEVDRATEEIDSILEAKEKEIRG
ncbi:MAG: ribosome recycling factor [Candidatus Fermentibacteraceae bacterium]